MDEHDTRPVDDPRTYAGPAPGKRFTTGIAGAAVVVVLLTAGLVLGRDFVLSRQSSDLQREVESGRNVLVARVSQVPTSRTIDLPATIHGYIETSVYAKVSGYLRQLSVDKGDQIKTGQVLAILDSPETDNQVATARANYHLAKITDDRNQELRRQGVIAQQDADTSHDTMLQDLAILKQNLSLQSYETIRAPLDGIVTARNVDPGVLVPAATSASSGVTPIIVLATLAPLRVYAYAPQNLALFVNNGDLARISVNERPGQTFNGSVIRHSEAIDTASRTMLVEVDLPNQDRSLVPGMYGRMTLNVKVAERGTVVRDDALVFRGGKVNVPVVRDGRLHLIDVTLGYDDGQQAVVHGDVRDDDLVALNVGQAATEGEPVHPVMASQQ